MGQRPLVVLAFDKGYGPHPEDSDSDTEMFELPRRKYSELPIIPNRLTPPKLLEPPKQFGDGMFAKQCIVCPSSWPKK